MEEDCRQCKIPEVISGEITLSMKEWTILEKIRFWVLMYGKFTGWIANKMFFVSALAVFVMVWPIVIDVVLRFFDKFTWFYRFDTYVPGVAEIEELLMLIIVFMGLAWADYEGGHIRVDLIYDYFPQWLKNTLAFFHTSLMGTFTLAMAIFIFLAAIEKYHVGDHTADLNIPYWPFYVIAGIGALVLCMCILKQTLDAFLDILESKQPIQYICMVIFTALAFAMMYAAFALHGTDMAYEYGTIATIGVLAMLLVLLLRMPIGFTMGIVGLLGLIVISISPMVAMSYLGSSPTSTVLNLVMTVVPMFVLMGELALYSGISSELFSAASIWLGRVPGGLAVAGVAGCTGFAAICGDSLATAMTMTSVALPEMQKRNYNEGLACAALASGGTLGILIPPSLGFIMYAIVTEESIGNLFIAGIIPGLLLAVLFCVMIALMTLKWPDLCPRGEHYSMKEKLASIKGIIPMLLLIVLIIGGILGGYFSPTEAGAVGAAGTLAYSLIRRRLSFPNFIRSVVSTAGITARLMMILIGVNILGYFLAGTQMPKLLADWILSLGTNKYVVFLAIVGMYVILGCLMNVVPMILLTLPAIFPSVQALGFDPVWFGVVTVILMEMGQITPPMGVVVFAIAGMPNTPPMATIFKYILPFVFAMFVMVGLMTLVPDIALILPKLLMDYTYFPPVPL